MPCGSSIGCIGGRKARTSRRAGATGEWLPGASVRQISGETEDRRQGRRYDRGSRRSSSGKLNHRWVVDATGSQAGLQAAIRMVEPRGTIILKSTVHGEIPLDTAPVIVNEITLIGSRCGRFEPALELLQLGAIDVSSMISERMPLANAPAAFEKAAQRGVLKVLLSN